MIPPLPHRALAELLATAVLVFAGCGAIVTDAVHPGALGNVGIALVFGLTVAVLAAATGPISGGHFNPAVTTAFVLARHLAVRDGAAYIGAQLAGAGFGAGLLALLWPAHPAALGTTMPTVAIPVALVYEGLMTALLMFVIRSVGASTAGHVGGAFAIGSVIGLDALFGGPLTGASMNPARSFGPALLSGQWESLWVYVVGPIAGAAVGSVAFESLTRRSGYAGPSR
ncbi:MAG: MIP/aquaporin family protein [Candidatus Limnocylindria bacterium]